MARSWSTSPTNRSIRSSTPINRKLDKIILRDDREAKTNHIYHWEVGEREKTDAAIAKSDVTIKERILSPRCHPAPLEPCGCVSDMNGATGRLTIYMTSQAPHVHRTAFSLVTGIPEDKIHVISPDVGGGFGNKVPVYPGYVVATVASVILGVPVKWVETRTENLTTTGFARDYHMDVEIGATKDGKVTALKVSTTADHGAFDAAADPRKYPAGMFGIVTGSYDFPTAFAEVDAYFTNKAPGGIAYRCSFRVTEAAFAIERAMDILAHKLGVDPVQLRMQNFIKKEQFPYPSPLGFTYDSGDYAATTKKALDIIGYDALRKEQAEKRKRGELMGIGVSTFTEIVGAGPGKHFDILGIKMFDSAEIRIHPTGSGIVRAGTKRQGQGHETTWAQIVAEELGLDPQELHGRRRRHRHRALRPRHVCQPQHAGCGRRARAGVAQDSREGAQDRRASAGSLRRRRRMEGLQVLAQRRARQERDDEGSRVRRVHQSGARHRTRLEATYYYDPPNLTFPNGTYIAVVDVDAGTGETKVRRFLAVDDCGVVINPMIVEGQIHGGLTEGFAMAFMQEIKFDEGGNHLNTNFTDYLVPTALETPHWETGSTVTPSPHHPIGAKGVGESPNVGSPQAFVNAVIDALSPMGITHIDMPLTREKVWSAIQGAQKKP